METAENSTDEFYIGLENSTDMRRTSHGTALTGVVFVCAITTAIVGNLLVIAIVVRRRELRENASNLFVVNLSVTDLLSAVFVMSSSFVMLAADVRSVHPILCNFTCAANYCLIIVSMLTLAFIGIDRYIAILHPMSYDAYMTRNHILAMIGYAWLQGVGFALPPILLDWNHYDYWEMVCAVDWRQANTAYYVIVACICCFLLPASILVFCYFLILKEMRKMNRVSSMPSTASSPKDSKTSPNSAAQHLKTSTKTVVSLMVVVACFFVFMTPFCVTKLLKVVGKTPVYLVAPPVNMAASVFGYLASVVNPFIYAIFRPNYRREFKIMWRLVWGRSIVDIIT